MRINSRILCVILATLLCAALFAGCSNTNNAGGASAATTEATTAVSTEATTTVAATTASTTSATTTPSDLEPVTLEWYLIEGAQKDQDMVWEELNKYFNEKINATVNYHPIDGSEYGTKISTFVSSGQMLDVLSANSNLSYADYSRKDAFVAIEGMLDEYCPETMALIPNDFWSGMTINGHIYGIPSYKDSCNIPGVIYNETLLTELGIDMSKLEWVSVYDLLPTYYEIQEKRAAAYPDDADLPITREFASLYEYNQYETISSLAVVNVPGIEAFEGKGSGEIVFNMYATNEYRTYCNTVLNLVKDNIMPFDAWNFDPSRLYTSEGKLPIISYGSGYIYVNKDFAGDKFDCGLLRNKYTIASTNYLQAAVSCVSVTSKNPERSLMMLELVNTDSFVATAIRFGLEDVHYKIQEDGRLDFTGMRNEDPNDRGYYAWYGAYIGSFMFCHVPNTYPANFTDMMKEANEQAISDTNMGFIFNSEPVQNEVAACSSVIGEYETNFLFGFIENVDEILDEFQAELEANGAQKIVDEAQSQLTAWRTAEGK